MANTSLPAAATESIDAPLAQEDEEMSEKVTDRDLFNVMLAHLEPASRAALKAALTVTDDPRQSALLPTIAVAAFGIPMTALVLKVAELHEPDRDKRIEFARKLLNGVLADAIETYDAANAAAGENDPLNVLLEAMREREAPRGAAAG